MQIVSADTLKLLYFLDSLESELLTEQMHRRQDHSVYVLM